MGLFGSIKNAIARRSELLKQHEADYTAAVQEKDDAISERDAALEALQPYKERAETAEAQLAEIAADLGVPVDVPDTEPAQPETQAAETGDK